MVEQETLGGSEKCGDGQVWFPVVIVCSLVISLTCSWLVCQCREGEGFLVSMVAEMMVMGQVGEWVLW